MPGIALRFLLFLILITRQTHAQPALSRLVVSDSLLKNHVYALADKRFEGRQTGTKGQQEASLYCVRSFRQSHLSAVFSLDSLRGSLRQPFFYSRSRIKPFGARSGLAASSYEQYELISPPLTTDDSSQVIMGHNVAGLLIGTDLKKEILVLSAHYDHLGQNGDEIYHGADDNASGTAALLSIASLFDSLAQKGIRSRRSLLFVLFSGEEQGLLGSKHFVNNSPIPLQQFIADLNIDMVGRTDFKHRKNHNYCYLIAGKNDDMLRKTADAANKQSVAIDLDYAHDSENDPNQYFYRSDHYNFARFGIPVMFFSDGEHPDYHRPWDTADKINYGVLQKRATLVFQTAWLLANPPL
ncbi:M28 family peptidase [Spirosoma sp. RP8]|uniref:M28 family peptidase n=1 Tax=Spirosoma liriopis TaxID=2937440 RepID=A0ABT0HEV2_9BACT|nr:M28 family peptidase [Spirosoma liriopis]MCK8490682.1 M28 family peptidase [Spirosoma liriopis]